MADRNASEILLRASRERRARRGKPPPHALEACLGHLIGARSEQQPWHLLTPGRVTWEESYRTQTVWVSRPRLGATTVDVTCNTCASTVTLRVRSRALILFHYLMLVGMVAICAGLCYSVCHEVGDAVCGAALAVYVAAGLELAGLTTRHRAVTLVKQSQAGHMLLE